MKSFSLHIKDIGSSIKTSVNLHPPLLEKENSPFEVDIKTIEQIISCNTFKNSGSRMHLYQLADHFNASSTLCLVATTNQVYSIYLVGIDADYLLKVVDIQHTRRTRQSSTTYFYHPHGPCSRARTHTHKHAQRSQAPVCIHKLVDQSKDISHYQYTDTHAHTHSSIGS